MDELEKLLGRHVPPHIRPRRDLSGQSHGRTVPDMIVSSCLTYPCLAYS